MIDQAKISQPLIPYRQAMIDAVVTLCRVPSVKGPALIGQPFGAANAQVLATFLDLGQALGFKAVNLDGFCGYLEWGKTGPVVAMLGHLDVVPAIDGWTHDPFSPVVTTDRIIARGTADDKGPVVSALFAMKALRDEGFTPSGRIRLIAGLDEESGSDCMAHYVKVAELPAAGFTPDAEFPVIYAEKGIAHLELSYKYDPDSPSSSRRLIRAQSGQRANMVPAKCELTWQQPDGQTETEIFTGKAAHASMPWEGENAIAQALRCVAQTESPHPFAVFFNRYLSASWRGEGLGIEGSDASGPLTINPGILDLNQSEARLTLDIRYPASWSLSDLLIRMNQALAGEPVQIRIQNDYAPLQNDIQSPLIQKLMHVYNQLTDSSIEAIAIGGGTYARTMPNIVAFGPTFPGDPDVCHQVDEYITFDKLLASSAVYKEALRKLAT